MQAYDNDGLLAAEAAKAAAEAGVRAFRSALGMDTAEQASGVGLPAGAVQGSFLLPPQLLQGQKLRLGMKVPTSASHADILTCNEKLTNSCTLDVIFFLACLILSSPYVYRHRYNMTPAEDTMHP